MTAAVPGAQAPPLGPDSSQAREWLERELAEPAYEDRQGLLERLTQWLMGLVERGPSGTLPALLLWGTLALLIAGLVMVLVRSLRTNPAPPRADPDLFTAAPARTAQQHRIHARAALAAGEHDQAVLEAFRGMARDGMERTLLTSAPGLTVHEVVDGLTRAFPTKGAALAATATTFDGVRYGERGADAQAGSAAVDLGEDVATARPLLPQVIAPTEGAAR